MFLLRLKEMRVLSVKMANVAGSFLRIRKLRLMMSLRDEMSKLKGFYHQKLWPNKVSVCPDVKYWKLFESRNLIDGLLFNISYYLLLVA